MDFDQDFTGRENVELNGVDPRHPEGPDPELMDEIVSFAELEQFIDLPVRTYSSGMYMRLGFAIAAHIRADVLLLDEVFAVGDEEYQRKRFGKIHEFKSRGGTIVFVSHDAHAVERLCDRAVLLRQGSIVFDGETRDAISAYRRLLADERSPDEMAAGLREWGSGEAKIVSVRVLDSDGEPRVQFASGEPSTVELVVAAEAGVAAPNVSLSVREHGGLAIGGVVSPTAELGWGDGPGERLLRFEIDHLPLAGGRFYLRCGLSDVETGKVVDLHDDAARASCLVPVGGETGAVQFEGRWKRARKSSGPPRQSDSHDELTGPARTGRSSWSRPQSLSSSTTPSVRRSSRRMPS